MKYKFIVLFSIIIFGITNSFAYERDFEIEVSIENTIISQRSKEIPVKVKITNKAEDVLKTEGLGSLRFHFAKCLTCGDNVTFYDVFEAQSSIPAKRLNKNESFEFTANLAGLYWYSLFQSNLVFDEKDSFRKNVPLENIYFHASTAIPKGYKKDKNLKRTVPIYEKIKSNIITVVLKK